MYKHIYYNWDTIPKESIPQGSDDASIELLVSNGGYVHKEDPVVRFFFHPRFSSDIIGTYDLTAGVDGYVCGAWRRTNLRSRGASPIHNVLLLSISSEPEDEIQSRFPSIYSIAVDPFSSERIIRWERVAGSSGSNYRVSGDISLRLNMQEDTPCIFVAFLQKAVRVRKKDTISFRFEDGSIAHFPVLSAPVLEDKTFGRYFTSIPLSQKDITTFATLGWDMMKIEHCNGEPSMIVQNEYRDSYKAPISLSVFRRFAQEYRKALDEMGIHMTDAPEMLREEEKKVITEEPCFVYLMVDTTNGFHKIGISNHPEYREKTLQSEKPTIEMVCAKSFPSRLIAQSIESALHAAFTAKRVRGEWFNFNDEDVAQVKDTLK